MRRFSWCLVLLSGCVAQVGELTPAAPSDAGVSIDDAGLIELDAGAVDAGVDAGQVELDAGTDAGSTTVDAGAVFHAVVGAGWGGRRVRSCDDGATWGADARVAAENDDDWHRAYTPKYLTFGAGKFVFLSGWGTASTAWVSENGGSTWTSSVLSTTYGGVGFADGRFVLVGNRNIAGAPDTASGWAVDPMAPESMYDRAAAAFDGVWAAGADGNVQVKRSGAAMWQSVSQCTGTRHTSIGFSGGFTVGNGRLLSIGDNGDVCVVDVATGLHLGNSTLGSNAGMRAFFDGTHFLAATDDRLVRSTDGMTWTAQTLPMGVRFDHIVRSSTRRLIGVSSGGARAWFSDDDGATWQSATFPSGNGLLYVSVGDVNACP
ncbi:MAG: hypothetical protein JNM17_21055 [Archangium sp.]|nr:hypothetical protein [Archangium sp.]